MKDLIIEGLRALSNINPSDWEAYGELLLPTIGLAISAFWSFMRKLQVVNKGAFVLVWVVISIFAVSGILYVKSVISGNPVIAGAVTSLVIVLLHSFLFKPGKKFIAKKIAEAKLYNRVKAGSTVEEEIPGRVTSSF